MTESTIPEPKAEPEASDTSNPMATPEDEQKHPQPSAKKTVLVTGATSGLGAEFARQLGGAGYQLIVTGQNEERLAQTKTDVGAILAVSSDLTAPDGVASLLRQIEEAGLQIDLLVNNAGFTVYGPFAEESVESQLNLVRVNVLALTELTRMVLPQMIERGDGRILNVASSAAYLPGPLMSVYYASKAYVLSFSEGLSEELVGTGVTVTALAPGPVRTNFQERGEMGSARLFSSPFVAVSDPTSVVAAAIEGMQHGKRVVIPGRGTRAMVLATRLLPRSVLARGAKWMHGQR